MELLKRWCGTPGISGREERIRELIIKEMTPLVDKLEVDTLGNIIGLKKITLLRHRLQTGSNFFLTAHFSRCKVKRCQIGVDIF